jgi:hypothetical protein
MESDAWRNAGAANDEANPAILACDQPLQAEDGTEKELKRAVRAHMNLAAIDAF